MATSQVKRLVVMIWAFVSMGLASVQAAPLDTPPFYKIEYKGKVSYLLGSIHVGKADFYPMAAQIESIFDSAASLAVEADAASEDIPSLIRKYGIGQAPIDAETQAILDGYCKKRLNECAALRGYAPWLQSMQLGMARFEALGYSAVYGVEQVLISKNRGRPLLELESTEFQFRLMASFDSDTQWSMVKEAIEGPDEDMHGLISSWRTGDEQHLAELMEGQMSDGDDTELLEKILWQRNVDMAQRIRELMLDPDTPQPMFIAVGAGHVVGERSMVLEMQKHGARTTNCWKHQCSPR
ncbi:TraB/GumN family protein [uncultured Shewanella sp.]|uniref:TraB/GumN family protein n=1 Tax=Shewanella atlantica TaxID=271099 RepID=UPI0026053E2B|nr:TraB/GumN family protein [uncultured Shewanella sp.]